MATDDKKAVQNQKVFIQLGDVMDIQKQYLNWKVQFGRAKAENREADIQILRIRKSTYEQIIQTLGLPIDIELGI